MKRFYCFILYAILCICAYSQTYIYTATGEKILFQNENKHIVKVVGFNDTSHLDNLFVVISSNDTDAQRITRTIFLTSLSIEFLNLISSQNGCTSVFSNVYSIKNDGLYWETDRIFVKPKQGRNIESILQNAKIQYGAVRQFGSDTNAYMVELLNNKAVVASNILYENGEVLFSQPDWGMLISPDSYTFDDQWNLNNTEYGYDINVIEAWSRSTGENIRVAVVDEGVELTHPYLSNNLYPGFDATDGALGGANGSNKPGDSHGTKCAGVISSNGVSDNDVKGIAYDAKIVPVRIAYKQLDGKGNWITYTSWLVSGLHYAWLNSDVISNSWSSGRGTSEMIEIEIRNALSLGRGGKGCVICFSSGNDNLNSVSYTASIDGVISVGAISPCGERKNPSSCDGEQWGSNYGDGLKIVAPGVWIPTTGLDGTIIGNFNGTSAACPHIAAVSALILSINPNLAWMSVDSILSVTASRIGDYSYITTDDHQYGTWSNQMGYGLVDAKTAVQLAYELQYKPDLYIRDDVADSGIEPNNSIVVYTKSPDIWLTTTNGDIVNRFVEGHQYIVNVRIHNGDTLNTRSMVKMKLNWARVSNNMDWNRAWNGSPQIPCLMQRSGLVGEKIIEEPIAAGAERVVSFEWTAPTWPGNMENCPRPMANSSWGCALLARVDDGHETVGENQRNYDIRNFVTQNNNVAMKNLTIVKENSGEILAAIDLRRDRGDGLVRISYTSSQSEDGSYINDVANVYLQLDPRLLSSWPVYSRQMTGCRPISDSVFLITDTVAKLDGFEIDTNETYFVGSYIRYRVAISDSAEHVFSLKVEIINADSIIDEGIMQFSTIYDASAYHSVTAYSDMTVMSGETFELSAESNVQDAVYEWYDMQDVLVGTGANVTLTTTSTRQYYVRSYSLMDNTLGYDTVTITVKRGMITKLTPNPARNQVLVKYVLADGVTSPNVSLRNSAGIVVYSEPIGFHPALCHINLRGLEAGNYIVSIEEGGMVLDTKALVVR